MKFHVCTKVWEYPANSTEYIDKLRGLGFKFVKHSSGDFLKTSGSCVIVELNSLEELCAFTKKWGACEIFNDYIEILDEVVSYE